jgi:hypothetical protein
LLAGPDLRYLLGAMPMSPEEAEEALDGLPLVPAMSGSIAEMKALRDRCLEVDLPAVVGCPPAAGGRGGG